MTDYFDLHVQQSSEVEKVFKKLAKLKFKYVGVSFKLHEREKIKEVSKLAKETGLEFFSRVDLEVSDMGEYHKLTSKARGKFDLICIEKSPAYVLKKVNLKKISLISVSTLSPRLIWKIKSMEGRLFIEFNFSEFFREFKSRTKKAERMIVNSMIYDAFKIPIILCSGARDEHGVLSPIQMIYSFSALLGKKEVNKKYISTIPQALIRSIFPLKWGIEGI